MHLMVNRLNTNSGPVTFWYVQFSGGGGGGDDGGGGDGDAGCCYFKCVNTPNTICLWLVITLCVFPNFNVFVACSRIFHTLGCNRPLHSSTFTQQMDIYTHTHNK